MSQEPALVPRKVAYRLAGHVLFGAATLLQAKNRGLPGRQRDADERFAAALEIDRLVNEDDDCIHGVGLDAAVLGYLLALLSDYTAARPELEAEMDTLKLPSLGVIKNTDYVAITKRVISGVK